MSSINIISSTIYTNKKSNFLMIFVYCRASTLDLLGKQIMLDFEPFNPAGGRNLRKAVILEEKYAKIHINSR